MRLVLVPRTATGFFTIPSVISALLYCIAPEL